MKPILSKTVSVLFRSPRRRTFDIEVNVWRDTASLREYRNAKIHGAPSQAVAFVWQPRTRYRVDSSGRLCRTPYLCEVNFSLECGTPLVIAHEAFHVAMAIARRIRVNPACSKREKDRVMEESFAIAHETITSHLATVVRDASQRFLKATGQ